MYQKTKIPNGPLLITAPREGTSASWTFGIAVIFGIMVISM